VNKRQILQRSNRFVEKELATRALLLVSGVGEGAENNGKRLRNRCKARRESRGKKHGMPKGKGQNHLSKVSWEGPEGRSSKYRTG
jgi:hypothetical protein